MKNVLPLHGYLNVLDPGTEVHLKEEHVADSWIVEKPTSDGVIRSLELFDQAGRDIASFFGVRVEGKKQSEEWRTALTTLETE